MKIKIIDLLAKIANKEEAPEKIMYNNKLYQRFHNPWNELYYYQVPGNSDFLLEQLASTSDLNDYIEVIEEDKKIEFIEIEELTCGAYDFEKQTINLLIKNQKKLIDEINKLKGND